MSSHHPSRRGHAPSTSAADLPDIQLPAPQTAGGLTGRALHGVGWLVGRALRGVALGTVRGTTATARGIYGALRWLAVSVWRMARGLWAIIAHVVGAMLGRKGGKAAGSPDKTGTAGTAGTVGPAPPDGKSGAPGRSQAADGRQHHAGGNPETGQHGATAASPEGTDRSASPYLSMQPPAMSPIPARKMPQGPTRPRAPRSGWPLAVRLVLLVALLMGGDIARYAVWPPVATLAKQNPAATSFMEYRQEQWARQGRGPSYRQIWVGLGNISRNLVLAVTIAEDDKFWQHEGFDLDGMEEAFLRNIEEGRIAAGGSTITQQLAKNLWFTPEKSLSRKAKEAIMAWRLERELSKKRILELYLNVVEWGDGVFGAEAAARHHFGKSAAALTSWEAARLAAVLPNPLRWSPTGTSRGVQVRASIIHSRMERRMGGG
ncbi:monofunctional biosynthetic peptidoglycan transglycosylase [Nitratidesulfovibrio sp. SRB-5]|uniref:monofunctional biosynthetic peptidoglycan transglycosylase n=1 Tax=Nitratidesulfovibrio sp. SRB-5 TaxID=2872636 RepID=UPI001024E080|nr:monofunctional biosynthetic peptidoglycan transglycosylase [Nitratidesulfovibrio sp. SRB-5]MBZ2173519.1 monofunctional biosynthetic peptidoglycan transglycosylase [Nitratidesulfovibrio sp. SRB-5]RXF76659.1 monofunctional biosynthetic peptidoglycan transglycosylase [Desulfovibrio sp. DS-1]